jgi:ADP-ribosyl-[dinitrogen reductase] hydrolase
MLGAILGDISGTHWMGRECTPDTFQLLHADVHLSGHALGHLVLAKSLVDRSPLERAYTIWKARLPKLDDRGIARYVCCGWLAKSLDEAQVLARRAIAQHPHPAYEQVQIAEAVAGLIWLARQARTDEQLRDTAEVRYACNMPGEASGSLALLNCDLTDLDRVALSLDCALGAESAAEAIRLAVFAASAAEDGELPALAGALAEARFGLPHDLARQAISHVPVELRAAVAGVYAKSQTPMWRAPPPPVAAIPEPSSKVGWLSRLKTRIVRAR